jgi:hypothetical protein
LRPAANAAGPNNCVPRPQQPPPPGALTYLDVCGIFWADGAWVAAAARGVAGCSRRGELPRTSEAGAFGHSRGASQHAPGHQPANLLHLCMILAALVPPPTSHPPGLLSNLAVGPC